MGEKTVIRVSFWKTCKKFPPNRFQKKTSIHINSQECCSNIATNLLPFCLSLSISQEKEATSSGIFSILEKILRERFITEEVCGTGELKSVTVEIIVFNKAAREKSCPWNKRICNKAKVELKK